LSTAPAWHQTVSSMLAANAGVRRRPYDVSRHHQFESAREAVAVDRGEHRQRRGFDPGQNLMTAADEFGKPLTAGALLHDFVEIRPRAKMFAGRREHQRAYVSVRLCGVERAQQRLHQFERNAVEALRSIERQHRHATDTLVAYCVAHAVTAEAGAIGARADDAARLTRLVRDRDPTNFFSRYDHLLNLRGAVTNLQTHNVT
jgi:hypothetical protein